jgi:hypothetical protein
VTQVEEKAKENCSDKNTGSDQKAGWLPPENPDDLAPIAQDIPQITAKTRDSVRKQANDLSYGKLGIYK